MGSDSIKSAGGTACVCGDKVQPESGNRYAVEVFVVWNWKDPDFEAR